MADKHIFSRIDRLKKSIPGPGVGILLQNASGWTAHRGTLQRDFQNEEQARRFLEQCSSVIVIALERGV